MTDAELQALKAQCHTILPGHRLQTPAETFRQMADWCEAHQVSHDTYGEGELIQAFEQKIATLLGMEAGLFCITGTMTQVTALRLACEERGSPLVALHPTSHILVHERSNYQIQRDFTALQIGNPFRTWSLADLETQPELISAVQYELPMREIGGQLPTWETLSDIKRHCRKHDIHLHMDGARLWEAATGYGKPPAEVAEGFDSVYVSFYKGIGGLAGAMLLGRKDFIARARLSFQRQGGNVFRRTPYVVAAAMQFDQRLAQLPACLSRTRAIYDVLKDYPLFQINPAAAQVNMLHVYLPLDKDRAMEARNRIAQTQGIWLFNQAVHSALSGQSMFEWYVGDQMLTIGDDQLRRSLDLLQQACQTSG